VARYQGSPEEMAIHAHIGARIRAGRRALGMSQTALADTIGITFQQLQKYERGVNRISAVRLQRLAAVMGVPWQHFFPEAIGAAALDCTALAAAILPEMPATHEILGRLHQLTPSLRHSLLQILWEISAPAQGMRD
jgi:transcriptional regulator with XRE-family HTH domain